MSTTEKEKTVSMNSQQSPNGLTAVEQVINEVYGPKHNAKRQPARWLKWSLALVMPLLAGLANAADAPAVATPSAPSPLTSLSKPSWLTDLSLGVKESYDDNVFFSGADPSFYQGLNLKAVKSPIAIAVQNSTAFVTTVSPKIGVNFAPLLGDKSIFQVLSLGYAPDFVNYSEHSTENYDSHKMAATVKGKVDSFTFNLENSVNVIDGSDYGALYPNKLNSAYATAVLRERRDQIQDRSTATFQYDTDKFFVRPTASFLYYDLGTKQLAGKDSMLGGLKGYQNYVDRYDVNGGLDFGYKVQPKFAATLGYRYGSQYQQMFASNVDTNHLSSSSDYQRVLFGVEGKPVKWLDAKLQIGPDFRTYGPHAAVTDRDLVTYYGEASLTATVSPKDTIAFKYRQNQWVSSTGMVPYFDSTYDLSYKRKLTEKLTLDLGTRFLESDYTSGLDATTLKGPNQRDDTQTTLSTGLSYAFNSHASVSLAYAIDLGRNLQDDLTPSPSSTREFNHSLVTLGAVFKF